MRETDFSTKEAKSESDVINFYDEYATSWDDRFGDSFATKHFIERRWHSFEDAIEKCQPKRGLAVELGVGTGVYINRASKLFNKIVAVDGSKKMLDALRVTLEKNNIDGVTLVNSNVLDIKEVNDSSVDCVYFFGLIEHIIDMDGFINELKRTLKKGGVLIGVTPNGTSPWYSMRSAVRGTGKHCSTDSYYSIRELDKIFIPGGFGRVYASHWGAVPAGIGDVFGGFLSKLEPLIEKTPLRIYLGGLTFGYILE
ncbi:MAG: class I SAM-dependent methyltransferase [Actinobacteria bacterium]|nr:class I SAM-dependent methyltransferase [Actinomycetota bacterium]